MSIMMTLGDFNTSEKASLPNFWVRIFNTKNIKNSKAAFLLAILLLFVRNVIKLLYKKIYNRYYHLC